MESQRTKFAIGLFVLSGLLLGAIIIIWAGASDVFLKGSLYTVYFDESVQGLQVDSTVKYRGVEIGKVESIHVAPDDTLIEVVMKIDLPRDLQKHVYARLRTAGITGIVFIELDRIGRGMQVDFREVPFKSDYPIIPSSRSEISRLLTDVDTIMQNIKSIDFKGISDQLKASTRAVEVLLTDRRMDRIIANLESASIAMDRSVAELQKKIDAVDIQGVVTGIHETLSEARGLIQSVQQEIKEMKLAQQAAKAGDAFDTLAQQTAKTGGKAEKILDTLDRSAASVAITLQDTSENIRVTSEYLQTLAESLKNNPPELIFGHPAPPRKPME
jgi:phospholipid/cholesterol/gamma-HCH transport system substrate-binding protein